MPRLTPRQQLTERVAERLHERGFNDQAAYAAAVLAVDAWYARNEDSEFHLLVCQEAVASVMSVIPTFAANMRAAFEGAMANARALTEAMTPWMELAEQFNSKANEPATPAIEFDASGLPINTNPEFDTPLAPADRQGEPCIEEGCGSTAVPGTAFCRDCMPQPTQDTAILHMVQADLARGIEVPEELIDVANEVSLEDTGRPAAHFQPFQRPEGMPADAPAPMFQMSIQGADGEWMPMEGILSIELGGPPETPPEVIELTEREYHLAAARRLRQLGCTYQQLKEMHDRGDFETSQHHSAWFTFGNLINLEQLDRANFVLDNLIRGDAFGVDMDDAAIERAEAHYPTDRITGAPHHFIVNGDHSGCGCGGHDPSCTIWDVPAWNHKATMCRIRRQLCIHHPRHTYGEPCAEYHENLADLVRPPVVGRTTEGEEVRGPASG